MKQIAHSKPLLGDAEAQAAADVVTSGYLAYGPQCRAFEEELAEAVGRKYAVVMANGHAALEIYLESLNLPQGSKIRLPSYCCSALRHSTHRSNYQPVIDDVAEGTLGLAAEGPDTAATLAVNTFAVPCEAANQKEGFVLEDCAMGFAPGVTGVRSHAALLSFYATKMFTSGQGGALLTDDEALVAEWRSLLQYDNQSRYRAVGNRHLTDMQAAVGRVQLKRYPEFLQRRSEIAAQYKEAFSEGPVKFHSMVNLAQHGALFRFPLVVSPQNRDALIAHLKEKGIETKKPVWRPLHRDFGGNPQNYSVSEAANDTLVSLPFYPGLSDGDVQRVVASVRSFFS